MTKKEANIIIQACLKYRIFHTCRCEGDVYVINFPQNLNFRSFVAAKLAVNSMVLENWNKPKPKDTPATLDLSGLNFSGYGIKKKKEYEPGKWAENRMKN